MKSKLASAALLIAVAPFAALQPIAARADDAAPAPSPQGARALYKEALAAREAKDLAAYRRKLEEARRTFPDPANLWFRLAGARVLAGDFTAAFEALEAHLLTGIVRPDFATNEDLAPLHEHQRWAPLAAAQAKLAEPQVRSEAAFTLAPGGRLVEGIAHDVSGGSLFFSVVNERTILRRAPDGTLTPFAHLAGALPGSPLGIAIDSWRHLLWTVTAELSQGTGLPEAEKNRSALAAFDLETGKLAQRIDAPEGAMLNDLVLDARGTVFASDTGRGTVVRLRTGSKELEDLAPVGTMLSPGGLALSPDGRRLHVADWSAGLAVFELEPVAFRAVNAEGAPVVAAPVRWLAPPSSGTVLGIDGLLRDGDTLIGIQNGVSPARITRFTLSADGLALVNTELLERAVPGWDEPTLGVLVDGTLLYVATSHWPKFPEDGPAPNPATLSATEIRRLALR